jgi:LysR family transcriptional activator of nhaA
VDWLNYHHLLYFHTVVREGTVTAAAKKLRLAQPTISGQIRTLEEALGGELFVRSGRKLELTELGHVVHRYAEEIFSLGRELMDTVRSHPTGQPSRLVVGVSDVVPKIITHRLLAPALALPDPVHIVVREDKTERLLAELSVEGLDLVLSDAPIAGQAHVRAFNHVLGECGVSFFAKPEIAKRLPRGFPRSLDGAPVVLPTPTTMLRRSLDAWFEALDVRPRIVAEVEDSALMKVFGEQGAGVFPAPTAVEREIVRRYGVRAIGHTDAVRERFYAITVERRIKHPAVLAISTAAREGILKER